MPAAHKPTGPRLSLLIAPRHAGKRIAEQQEKAFMKALCEASEDLEFVEDPQGRWFGWRARKRDG